MARASASPPGSDAPWRGYVDAGGLSTYYEAEGTGEAVMLLHGGFVTIETWAAQRAALAARFRVYLPERRGHGRTPDVPGRTGYDLMAADTIAFMDAVGLPSAHLVGWSDGGVVALEIALDHPERVTKLVLVGTPAHVDGQTTESIEWTRNVTPDELGEYRAAYDRLSPDGAGHFGAVFDKLTALWRAEPRHEMTDLARITAPTLILIGDHDVPTIEHAAGMRRAIPDAQLAVVPGAGHGVLFEKPDLVNGLLLEFLTT